MWEKNIAVDDLHLIMDGSNINISSPIQLLHYFKNH